MISADNLVSLKSRTGNLIGSAFEKLNSSKTVDRLGEKIGKASLGRTVGIAFGIQAFLLLILGVTSISGASSALGDVGDLNAVVRQQRLLLTARIAVVAAGDRVKAFALHSDASTQSAARAAVVNAADAVREASKSALNAEQDELLSKAAKVAAEGPNDFDEIAAQQTGIRKLVIDHIYVEGQAIQNDLDGLAQRALGLGEAEAASKSREASRHYSQVRIAMERFLSDSSKANLEETKAQSLALEDVLNQIYDSTKNTTLLAQADGVIKRLISYDNAFKSIVRLTGQRDAVMHHLLDTHAAVVGGAVDKVGRAVDSIQSGAVNSARLKLGGVFMLSLLSSGAGIFFVLIASLLFRRAVTVPIVRITKDMQLLAQGDLEHEASFTERADEIGGMARSLEVFRLNAIEMQRLQSEESGRVEVQRRADQNALEAERRADEERQQARAEAERSKRKMLTDLATQFENQVARAMTTVTQAAREIDDGARRVATTVASSKDIATSVTLAAVEASASTTMIASATEEMNLSLAEVSKQVRESSQCASRAVDRVGQTDAIVTSLARDAAEIGEVVSLVQGIAQQVNLLALNATIEASRAGDAGRGFAVVAAEVKSLAQQAAAATARISERVSSIQNVSQTAMQAINEIGHVIGEMGVLATSVAVAVEQQVSTTAEIARTTTLAATGTSQVTNNLKRVQEGVSISGDAAESARIAAEQVSVQTGALQREIDSFLSSVRAA